MLAGGIPLSATIRNATVELGSLYLHGFLVSLDFRLHFLFELAMAVITPAAALVGEPELSLDPVNTRAALVGGDPELCSDYWSGLVAPVLERRS